MGDNADDSVKRADEQPRAGQRLANARRANGISMRDIAKELHLDEVKVQALEDNRFDVLGAPVFTKGYLRKYAELVHVSIDDVLADYYRMNRATGAPPVVGPRRPKAPSPVNPGPWIGTIIVVVLIAGAAWWWINRSPATTEPAPRNVTGIGQAGSQEPAREQPANAAAGGDEAMPSDSERASGSAAAVTNSGETAVVEPVQAPVQQSAPAAATPVPDAATTQVSLRFSGDCWTEVTDGGGDRLFFGLGTAGRNVTVSGVPPIRVLLGNNDNVSLQVNGQDYVVAPSQLRGNTARLSIGGP